MAKDVSLSRIFLTALKLGAFTFGGGYAMIPLFEDAFVRKYGWITRDDMLNMIALSQSVPGAIAINCGILIGYKLKKLRGALVAAAGIVLPSLVFLTIVTFAYEAVSDDIYVAGALRGVRAAVVALLFFAFFSFLKPLYKDWLAMTAFFTAFALSLVFGISSIIIIFGAVAFGITAGILRIKKERGGS
ncbi:MAG: chromate transporter [Christensenellales bacterium]